MGRRGLKVSLKAKWIQWANRVIHAWLINIKGWCIYQWGWWNHELDHNSGPSHSILCALRAELNDCTGLSGRTIGTMQAVSFRGELVHWMSLPSLLYNGTKSRWSWQRLEIDLENILHDLPAQILHAHYCLLSFIPAFFFHFLPFGTSSTSLVSWFHDGAEMPIKPLAISRTASPICISVLGWLPEHHLLHMNYDGSISAVSTFHSIQLPIIIIIYFFWQTTLKF